MYYRFISILLSSPEYMLLYQCDSALYKSLILLQLLSVTALAEHRAPRNPQGLRGCYILILFRSWHSVVMTTSCSSYFTFQSMLPFKKEMLNLWWKTKCENCMSQHIFIYAYHNTFGPLKPRLQKRSSHSTFWNKSWLHKQQVWYSGKFMTYEFLLRSESRKMHVKNNFLSEIIILRPIIIIITHTNNSG